MAKARGQADVRRYFDGLRADVVRSLLPGAARAGAKVIADEARGKVTSDAVREGVRTAVRADGGRVVARIYVAKGWALSVGIWLEYGTDPHYITVDDSQREGMSAGRINRLKKNAGTLVINGTPVGKTVLHSGARPHPFLRPALDTKESEALAVAQSHIDKRIRQGGIAQDSEGSDE